MDEDEWEELAYVVGCSCDHDPNDHSWSECEIDECTCEGHWEE